MNNDFKITAINKSTLSFNIISRKNSVFLIRDVCCRSRDITLYFLKLTCKMVKVTFKKINE